MSESANPVSAPRNRETALSVAYLRLLGSTQTEAASATGVDARTVGRWESSSWWAGVKREAADRWLAGLASKARRGLEREVEKDGSLALKVLERLEPALAPNAVHIAIDVDYAELSTAELSAIAAGANPRTVLARTRGSL